MKKLFLMGCALWCGVWLATAQDVIRRTDDRSIEVKVIEITPETVRYKRFSNPDGPTYVLPVSDIREIVYPNGEKDVFNPGEVPEIPAPVTESADGDVGVGTTETGRSAVPARTDRTRETVPPVREAETPAAETVPPGYVRRTYAIGDYYEQGEVRGVVCDLSEDRMHGLLLSLDEVWLPWSTFRKPDLQAVGATDHAHGEANLRVVEQYIAGNGLSWDAFPAFAWCRAKGEGWYLPAIDELLRIGANYNGGRRTVNDRQARNKFNDALRANGGERMDRLAYYFSSTEQDAKSAVCSHTSLEPPYIEPIPKYTKFLVRAVRKF